MDSKHVKTEAGAPPAPQPEKIQWVTKKSWDEFRVTGLFMFMNMFLHAFGWAIVVEVDKETKLVTACYPARVKFRGFDEPDQDEMHKRIANYIVENADELKKDTLL